MKNKILVAIIALVGVLVLGVLWYQGLLGNGDRKLFLVIKQQPAMVALFDKAVNSDKDLAENPDKAEKYFNSGLYWKSIAEQMAGTDTERKVFFVRSLEVYEKGIVKFGRANILFYLNGGKLAERLEDYAKAETYYKKAIEISSADESGYLYLVDLYSYKLDKPEAEVLQVFSSGEKAMMNPLIIISSRASYLRRIGDFANALKDYQSLSKALPNNQGYKEIIQELQSKLQTE